MKALFASLFILAGVAAAPAQAELFHTERNCTSSTLLDGGVTTCGGEMRVRFVSNGQGRLYGMRLVAPATHCAAVRYKIRLPQTQGFVATSLWLEPGQEETVEIGQNFAAGSRFVYVSAEGRVGGCNAGQMRSWALDTEIFDLN